MIALSRDRTTLAAASGLAAASALAWVGLLGLGDLKGLVGFLAGWTLMMVAMMLPSVAPLMLLYRGPRVTLAIGYLAVWGAGGVLPYAAMERGLVLSVPIVLGLAGAYELTALKTACLRRCRSPADFLMLRYRSGPLRLGIEHALWCAGCCVGLMVVLVLAASMAPSWAALIALALFVQKVLPLGEVAAKLTGVGLLVAAAVLAIV